MNYEEKENHYIFLHSITWSSACDDDRLYDERLYGIQV